MKIAVLPGDGIGKEVIAQAVRILKTIVKIYLALQLCMGVAVWIRYGSTAASIMITLTTLPNLSLIGWIVVLEVKLKMADE